LSEFRAELDSLEDDASDDEVDSAFEKGLAAWDALSMDVRRAIIRGRYRVQVTAGGRGFDRVQVTPR
jgi:hypothetical protein